MKLRSTSHGLLFSAAMARANVAGLKTQTRRIVRPQIPTAFGTQTKGALFIENKIETMAEHCPYGQPGQEIWQKETWAPRNPVTRWVPGMPVRYRADEDRPEWKGIWKPSILQPRLASRFTATLTEIRVERVGEISAEDAQAEGLSQVTKDDGQTWKWGIPDRDGLPGTDDLGWNWPFWNVDPRQAYRHLWNLIHARPSPVRGVDKTITHYEAFPWQLSDFAALGPTHATAMQTKTWRGLRLILLPNPFVYVLKYTPNPQA